MPMNASGVSHIAICVRDLDVSLKFYCDVLGMSIVSDVIQDTTTGGLPHVYAHSRATRRQVRLAYADGAKPTLTMTSHPGKTRTALPSNSTRWASATSPSALRTRKLSPKACQNRVSRWLPRWTFGPTPRAESAASTCTTRTASWSSSTPADDCTLARAAFHSKSDRPDEPEDEANDEPKRSANHPVPVAGRLCA